jgi:S-adenosylmethionine decarboxylase
MHGTEWVIDASGCDAAALQSGAAARGLISAIVAAMHLHPVAEPVWHQFPVTSGLTALLLLSESHVALHTFPEHGSVCLNIFCCRPREDFDFEAVLGEYFGAAAVTVRRIERQYGKAEPAGV